MAWTTPGTAVAGDVLTAAFWNLQVRDNLANLRALANVQTTPVTAATFTRQASTFADITGLSVSITPTATTSKILVSVSLNFGASSTADFFHLRLMRDSTAIGIGDAAGARDRTTSGANGGDTVELLNCSIVFLDTPNTTSATTYKVQVRNTNGAAGGIFYLNRTGLDTDGVYSRTISTITVQEIPA